MQAHTEHIGKTTRWLNFQTVFNILNTSLLSCRIFAVILVLYALKCVVFGRGKGQRDIR